MQMQDRLARLEARVEAGFERLETQANERFGLVHLRTDEIVDRIGRIEARLDGLENRLDDLDRRVGGLDDRLGTLEQKVENGFRAVDARLDQMFQTIAANTEVLLEAILPAAGNYDLILRGREAAVSKDEARTVASPFETHSCGVLLRTRSDSVAVGMRSRPAG
ncbi:hypothetical protein [Rhodovulum sp. PH10]|uniref:hypothetical protein n=1 Tax=Rhodovulum sp. PH10 TaxID=1187851 RepID=UPI0012FBAADA|nr:hypothetical protein [Rhodovulum sp. PH10]